MHQPYGEVILVNDIVRNCHLIPHFGRKADRRLTEANVNNAAPSFLVNPYFDMHSFCMYKLGSYDCLPG